MIRNFSIGDQVVVWTEGWMSRHEEPTKATIIVIDKAQVCATYYDEYYKAPAFGWFYANSVFSVIGQYHGHGSFEDNDEKGHTDNGSKQKEDEDLIHKLEHLNINTMQSLTHQDIDSD